MTWSRCSQYGSLHIPAAGPNYNNSQHAPDFYGSLGRMNWNGPIFQEER
jgi:hypothetical protein